MSCHSRLPVYCQVDLLSGTANAGIQLLIIYLCFKKKISAFTGMFITTHQYFFFRGNPPEFYARNLSALHQASSIGILLPRYF